MYIITYVGVIRTSHREEDLKRELLLQHVNLVQHLWNKVHLMKL